MKDLINESKICVLLTDIENNKVEMDYISIEKHFEIQLKALNELCLKTTPNLDEIKQYIEKTPELNQLSHYYRYCQSLRGAYQAFYANNSEIIPYIQKQEEMIKRNYENSPDTYDIIKEVTSLKKEIYNKYVLWSKAFSINLAYRYCIERDQIILFSHRIDGWSEPVYQLTPNFSVEIKTNFGYGRASYFYTKLKYKNIDITPFSEWIDYEFAQFSEIIRYTKSHELSNSSWYEAIEFCRDACNLSLQNEEIFVERYIISECEKMVSGLEEIFHKESFSFRYKSEGNGRYVVGKNGHVLTEFRGEKISGGLDFIDKILEFNQIIQIKSFINRIEQCNQKIQPILQSESVVIAEELVKLDEEYNKIKPSYLEVVRENNEYLAKKSELQKQMIFSKEIDSAQIDSMILNKKFIELYPDFIVFEQKYKSVIKEYRQLVQHINNLRKVLDKINNHNNKINLYFIKNTVDE